MYTKKDKMTKNGKKTSNTDKEVDVMLTATKIINDEKVYVKEMKLYFKELEKQSKKSTEQAKLDAQKALKKTGVINRNGSSKRKIVSWE